MSEIKIFYSTISNALTENQYVMLLNQLPKKLQTINKSYHNHKDRHLHLYGKLLLLEGLSRFGYGKHYIHKLRSNAHSKPVIPGIFDFNIAHSGNYVVCAISTGGEIGVDIEEIRSVDFSYFKNTMSANQWHLIHTSSDPCSAFFNLWTIKESVIKASDLSLDDLKEIETDWHSAWFHNVKWDLYPIEIDRNYSSHLAFQKAPNTIRIEYIQF